MGLKCSVLGHKYGDTTVDRDREEQGSEVVITIQEVETCRRCGAERVISENKEVKSIATPDDPTPVPTGTDDDGGEGPTTPAGGATDIDEDRPGESPETETVETDPTVEADPTVEPDPTVEADPTVEQGGPDGPAGTTDQGAEIIDAADDEPVNGGQSATADPSPAGERSGASDPDPVVDDELADPSIPDADSSGGPADVPAEDDAVILGDDDGGRAPGEWPEDPQDDADDDVPDWISNLGTDEPRIRAPDQGTEANKAVTVPEGDFHCPGCGYTTPVEESSLRAGDFCPECRQDSLVHEPEGAR